MSGPKRRTSLHVDQQRIADFVLRQAVRFEKLPYKVEAIEAYWGAGPDGWSVVLAAVVLGYSEWHDQYDEVVFARLQCKDDPTRDTVHPCEEAAEAQEIGRKLADTLNVPFRFTSPVEPDDAAPRWWDAEGAEDRTAAPPLNVQAAYPFADMWPHAVIEDEVPAWRWRWIVHVGYWMRDTGLAFVDADRQTLDPQLRISLNASFEDAEYTAQPSQNGATNIGCFAGLPAAMDCVDTLSAWLAYAGASVPIGLHYGPFVEDVDGLLLGDAFEVASGLAQWTQENRKSLKGSCPVVVDAFTVQQVPKNDRDCFVSAGRGEITRGGTVLEIFEMT